MNDGAMLSAIGLFIDIIGAGLIFFFGVVPKYRADGSIGIDMRPGEKHPAQIKARRLGPLYAALSKVGITLLGFGFIIQLAGNSFVRGLCCG